MLILFKNLTKNPCFFVVNSIQKYRLSSRDLKDFPKMNELAIKKTRYDGRSKKRKWEDRRSDKGEVLEHDSKQSKLENNRVVEVPVEKIIDKIKKRKFVLLMGYSGVGYLGMQRNPGKKTIEEEFFKALKNVGLINDFDFGQVQNLSFQRAARTDKGKFCDI